ncbi:MAG: hypothetical protein ACYSVY_12985 [Planctomycetota bacterium]|jgi:co-chaperonin GroES (HSP10)
MSEIPESAVTEIDGNGRDKQAERQKRLFELKSRLTPNKFRCAYNSILVRILPPDRITVGGIVLPDAHVKEPRIGKVVAVPKDDCTYKVGDTVLFRQYGGGLAELPGYEDMVVLQWRGDIADDVLGLWEGVEIPDEMWTCE